MSTEIIAEFLLSEVSKNQTNTILQSLVKLQSIKNKIPKLVQEEKYESVIQLCEFLVYVDSILKKCDKK